MFNPLLCNAQWFCKWVINLLNSDVVRLYCRQKMGLRKPDFS